MIIDHSLQQWSKYPIESVFYEQSSQIYYHCYIAFCALKLSTNCVSPILILHMSGFCTDTVVLYFVCSLEKTQNQLINVDNGDAVCFL